VCTTTVAAVLRTETDNRLDDGYEGASVLRTYQLLWGILKLSRVRILATALLTARVSTRGEQIAFCRQLDEKIRGVFLNIRSSGSSLRILYRT